MNYYVTDEVREKLDSDIPFSTSSSVNHIPSFFLEKENDGYVIPEEYRAVFSMRPMSNNSYNTLLRSKKVLPDGSYLSSDIYDKLVLDTLSKNIIGWERFFDVGSLEEIPYDDVYKNDNIDKMPISLKNDLINFNVEISCLQPHERAGL